MCAFYPLKSDLFHNGSSKAEQVDQVDISNIYFRNLNEDPSVHGIIVQMPLDSEEQVSLKLFTPTSSYSRLN